MSSRATALAFVALCVAQLALSGSGIARHERVLRLGTAYRFETAPVDPLDPFRGRYVRLAFTLARVPLPLPDGLGGDRVYAVLGTDEDGFARVTRLSADRPRAGDYLHVRAYPDFRGPDASQSWTRLELPFERFYMEESKAPEAERRYRQTQGAQRADGKAYAVVRVLDGLPVLEDLKLP